jgi:ligand-binding sensor domain-containing protein
MASVFMPSYWVSALLSDGQGGLWVRTGSGSGLAHRGVQGEWTWFTTDSGLPHNFVTTLLGDGQGGLWMGTS